MRVYWIRHGQMAIHARAAADVRSVNRLFNQEVGGGLTDRGRAEAEAVARHFRSHPVDAVYTSPLTRAAETAQVTAEALGDEAQVLEQLRELRTGALPEGSLAARWLGLVQGLPLVPQPAKRIALGATLIPLYFYAWHAGHTIGGEDRAALEARLDEAHALMRQAAGDDGRIAVFAHGYLIFYLSTILSRPGRTKLRPLLRPYIPNGSITELSIAPGRRPRLVAYAQTQHLR